MGQHRTKAAKQVAQQRRIESIQYRYNSSSTNTSSNEHSPQQKMTAKKEDTSLIIADLRKTVILSLLILGIIGALFFQLR